MAHDPRRDRRQRPPRQAHRRSLRRSSPQCRSSRVRTSPGRRCQALQQSPCRQLRLAQDEAVFDPVIARQLGVSPKTIPNRVSGVLRKLRVPDRARAVVLAREAAVDGPIRLVHCGHRSADDRAGSTYDTLESDVHTGLPARCCSNTPSTSKPGSVTILLRVR
ncbi:LuxR C-terminal-related transcriptional regulator [Kibdelosporangium banguiense]|uniref:LuxR C-terminal-related transcriptional regulator n=1 Tax=Kibdelosporangium banguiense TaxID=1365924 RepID=UPI001AE9FC34|nr:LuxR C-terminal-related transcriptional regulator [Kibdelosporangium banguiense]